MATSIEIIKKLKETDGTVFIVLGEDCYPAKVKNFVENGKKVSYVVADNYDEHKNYPEKYGCKELTK